MYTKTINYQKINLGGTEKSQNIIFTDKTVIQMTGVFAIVNSSFLNTT